MLCKTPVITVFLCVLTTLTFVQEEDNLATPPSVSWNRGGYDLQLDPAQGLRLSSESLPELLHVGGVLAGDAIDYDDRNVRDSGVRVDRAVMRIEGTFGDFDWRLAPDLKGIDTRGGFDEAWLAFAPTDFFRISAGLMEIATSVEHTIPEEDLPFVGYAFPAYLDGRTDLALRFDGEIEEGLFSYDLAATAGEGFTRLGERVSGNRFSARVMTYPLRFLDYSIKPLGYEIPLLSGLFFNVSYSHTEDFEGPLEVANPFRNRLFKVSRFDASESDFLSIGYGADLGPFQITHEWVRGGYRNVETPAGEETLDDQTTAWSLMFAWMITGEAYDSRPYRLRKGRFRSAPRQPLFWAPEPRGVGAFELALRYSNGDIDRDFFEFGMTDFTTSSQEFRTFSGALNWYPIENLRASFQIIRTIADQFPNEFDSHGRDTSYLFRLQYSF